MRQVTHPTAVCSVPRYNLLALKALRHCVATRRVKGGIWKWKVLTWMWRQWNEKPWKGKWFALCMSCMLPAVSCALVRDCCMHVRTGA